MSYRVPGFSYPGGKVKLREWLVRRMPMSGGKYVEPFAGRGNVFWLAVHMLDFREWWLNDPWTARWFEAIRRVDLRDIPNELTKAVVTTYNRRVRSRRNEDDVAAALESEVLFSGGVQGGMNYNWTRVPSLSGFKRRLATAKSILKTIAPKITALDWKGSGLEELSVNDFVYLDPPYEIVSKGIYSQNTVIHSELLEYLIDAPHLWMISGFISPLYIRHLGDPIARKSHKTSMHQQRKTNRNIVRQECIWTNYTIGPDGIPKRKRMKKERIQKVRRKK